MKVVIIEDEAPAFRRLQKTLEEVDPEIEILDVIDSVEESIKWIKNHQQPDLFFMDIQLNDGLSFDIFEEVDILKPVIFTTAFDEYMLKAFKVNSIDYLLKPIKKQELENALKKYQTLKSSLLNEPLQIQNLISQIQRTERKYKSRFLIKKGDKLFSLETSDCAFFNIHNGVLYANTFDRHQYIMDQTLEEVFAVLDPERFFKANRQFIINFKAIRSASRYFKGKILLELILPTDENIIVSAERASEFKLWFGDE